MRRHAVHVVVSALMVQINLESACCVVWVMSMRRKVFCVLCLVVEICFMFHSVVLSREEARRHNRWRVVSTSILAARCGVLMTYPGTKHLPGRGITINRVHARHVRFFTRCPRGERSPVSPCVLRSSRRLPLRTRSSRRFVLCCTDHPRLAEHARSQQHRTDKPPAMVACTPAQF